MFEPPPSLLLYPLRSSQYLDPIRHSWLEGWDQSSHHDVGSSTGDLARPTCTHVFPLFVQEAHFRVCDRGARRAEREIGIAGAALHAGAGEFSAAVC